MKDELKNAVIKLEKFKYPLIVLAVGALLMLMPAGTFTKEADGKNLSGDELFSQLLSCAEGMGQTRVIISQSGVVIVCEGADRAAVRLEIMRAVESYTGMSSDKITILKMAD